nr:Ty3/gypsy retrotransposon protein [Tanacetum cinerariifolium]
DMELILVPDRVEGVREGKSSSKEGRKVLIKWKDLPTYEASWELYSTIQKQFPDFHLEDKVVVWEGIFSGLLEGETKTDSLRRFYGIPYTGKEGLKRHFGAFPGDLSPGKHRWGRLVRDSFPGDNPRRK